MNNMFVTQMWEVKPDVLESIEVDTRCLSGPSSSNLVFSYMTNGLLSLPPRFTRGFGVLQSCTQS